MNRIQFDKLNILEQLQFINDNLKDNTLTCICEKIGIGRTTVRDRLTKEGYIFNKDLKQYIKNSEYKSNTNILQVAITSTDKEVSKHEYKSNTNIFNTKDAKHKMLNILEKHDDIEEMLNWYHNQKNVIEVDLSELKIDSSKLTGDIKVTTVRLYSDVWEDFRKFMESYKELKSMDIISMALIEFSNKYKK